MLGERIHEEHEFRKLAQFSPEKRKAYLLRKYTKQLQLTEAQQAEVRKIIDEKVDKIFQCTQRYEEEIDKLRRQHNERIKALLTSEQRQLFEEMKQRRRKRWQSDSSQNSY